MRAVLFGLVGFVLAVGGVEAKGCRAGQMTLVKDGSEMQVSAVSRSQVAVEGHKGERTLLKGSIANEPFIIDLASLQGSSAFLQSYAGTEPDAGGMPVRWGSKAAPWLNDGANVPVEVGPLKGTWRAVCR